MTTSNEETKTSKILDELMARRTLVLSGEINRAQVDDIGRRLILLQTQTLSYKPINFIIDSNGGGTGPALRLCDLMTALVMPPIIGIVMGSCGSAATFILLHCDHRLSTPHSGFLIHSGNRSHISIPVGQSISENLEHLLKEIERVEEEMIQLYMKKLTPHQWTKETSEDSKRSYVQSLIKRGDQSFNSWMTAEEAIDAGLITSIIRETLDIFKLPT